MQQIRGLEAGHVEVRELHVFPGSPARTARGARRPGRRRRRRGRRRFRGALRGRRRQRGGPSGAQAAGSGRLARVPHRRYLYHDTRTHAHARDENTDLSVFNAAHPKNARERVQLRYPFL